MSQQVMFGKKKMHARNGLLFDESEGWLKPAQVAKKLSSSGYGEDLDSVLKLAHKHGGNVSNEWKGAKDEALYHANRLKLIRIVDTETLGPLQAKVMKCARGFVAKRYKLTKKGWTVAQRLFGVPK